MKKITQEIIIILTILIVSYFLFAQFDVLEKIVEWSNNHEEFEIDELLSTSIVLVVLLLIFSVRRWRELFNKTKDLHNALNEIKTLKGIIPICSYCKKIRDEEGAWNQLEAYVHSHSDAKFSHGACPECCKKQMEEME